MKTYELTIENGNVTLINEFEEINGETVRIEAALYIPKNVTNLFASESVVGLYPEDIIVEEGNEEYCEKGHCLFSKDGERLLLVSQKAEIPADTKIVGNGMFPLPITSSEEINKILVDGVERITYRAFMLAWEINDKIVIPASVKSVDMLAFMIHSENVVTYEFSGDPHLDIGVFGTEAEIADTDSEADDIYKNLPKIFYVKPENIQVIAKANSGVAKYCKKYGIPVTLK